MERRPNNSDSEKRPNPHRAHRCSRSPCVAEMPLLSAAVPSLLSVPPAMAATSSSLRGGGRASPTPYFHHDGGVNPALLSGDVKASAASPPSLPRFFGSLVAPPLLDNRSVLSFILLLSLFCCFVSFRYCDFVPMGFHI